MKLEFNINNKIIERIDTNILTNNDIIICNFSFSEEWKHKEKYVIFWSSKNKSKIMSLGKGQKSECSIPENISKESLLAIQIYVDDNLKTQKLNIALTPTNYTIQEEINKCNKKDKIRDDYNTKKIFDEILTKLDSKVSSIQYDNGYLKCYAGEELIYSEPIFSDIYNDIENIVKEINSNIEWSGDYNDLKNIPNEFNPSPHTHHIIDVIDYEETDLNILLDVLGDEISKE